MSKILFITNRNILTTSGELRLIKNRAEVLFINYGISTDFLVLGTYSRIFSKMRAKINSGGSFITFGYCKKNPFSIIWSYNRLRKKTKEMISTGEYTSVIFSGAGISNLINQIDNNIKVLKYIDVHGSSEDIIEFAKKENIIKKLLFKMIYNIDVAALRRNARKVDGFWVVTESLENYLKERYLIKKESRFFRIPCATNCNDVDSRIHEINRRQYRTKYGISDEEVVFIYSGGVSPWQCIEETIDLYNILSNRLMKKSRLLIFSHDISRIKSLIGSDEDNGIIFDSYAPDELNKALCAGDYAFMLRKDCITNNVAFPNKYLEYVQSGMKLITTPYVNEVANQIKTFNLGVLYNFKNIDKIIDYINSEEKHTYDELTIKKVLMYNSFDNRLSVLAKEICNAEEIGR